MVKDQVNTLVLIQRGSTDAILHWPVNTFVYGRKWFHDVDSKKLAHFWTKYRAMWRFDLSATDHGHAFKWLFVGCVASYLDMGGISYFYATNMQSLDCVTKYLLLTGRNDASFILTEKRDSMPFIFIIITWYDGLLPPLRCISAPR